MRKRYIFSFMFLLLTGVRAFCSQSVVTNPVQFGEQLPSNTVHRIYQDKEGFIWLGTEDGVCRYDAYRVMVFKSGLNTPTLLTSNEITCFAESGNGHLLIGTQKGLNVLDKNTYQIKAFKEDSLDRQTIRCMLTTVDGSVWIGTGRYIYRYSSDLTSCKRYGFPQSDGGVNHFYEDADGNLWITFWKAGLYKYESEEDAFMAYPAIGKTNNPFKVYQDDRKNYWICTWGDGVYRFSPEAQDVDDIYIPQPILDNGKQVEEDTFFSIVQDEVNKYIWIVSISGVHALQYTPDGRVEDVDISGLFQQSNNIFSEIIKDCMGNLWVGTFGEGVLTVNFNNPPIENIPLLSIKEQTGTTPHVSVIYEDKGGDLWIHQNRRGLAFFNPSRRDVRFYTDYRSLKNLSGPNLVSCIADFRSIPDEVWLSSEDESNIYCLKKNGDDIDLSRVINLDDVDENAGFPRIFYEDKKNNIWIVTTQKLLQKPCNADTIRVFPFSPHIITGIAEDTRGSLWISSKNSGVYRISSSNLLATEQPTVESLNEENGKLPSSNVETIHADMAGKLWIGTKEGNVLVHDIVEGTTRDLSKELRMTGEGVLNIVSDDYGHVWIVTNNRVTEYNPVNGALRYYLESDGVHVNAFLSKSYFKSKSGKIYFGGNRGISVFTSSAQLARKPQNPRGLIADIKIDNLSVFHQNSNSKFNMQAQTLHLDPEDKNIEIDFSSLAYDSPGKIHYAYRMQGIDDQWIYPEDGRQFAIYSQLSKGNHSFLLKVTDDHGLWSDQVSVLKIYKRPAFYESNLAYTIYLFVFFLLTYISCRIVANRVRLRNELKIAQIEKDKTEELTQTKLRYFTNVSHDFLTPLTIISCLIDDMEITQKENVSNFNTIRANITRLRRLLQQVLDFRKVESGNMKLRLSYGDIVMFIKDTCYTNFLPLMKKKNIAFSFAADPNQIHAYFDADKIDKITFNLLSNAFKYTPENGAVQITLKQYAEQGHSYLSVEVKDTGIGISSEEIEQIFIRFYNNKTSAASETNGIGLSLTKELLELHHGTIQVESELGKGATFSFCIPIDEASYNEVELGKSKQISAYEEEQVEVEKPQEIEKEGTTVLLVEDNEEILKLISNILSRYYRVCTATNGVEALAVVADTDVDIIISDVMMPQMDGLELCRKLKNDLDTSHIPIILLTAKSSTDDRIECYNAGADGYISKPFDLKVLEARINNFMLHKKSKQQEFKTDVDINLSKLEYPSMDEDFLKKAVLVIEKHLAEFEFDVNAFAEHLNMSKSSLYRKIKTMTGLSPVEFIRNIKLKHACRMLKSQSMPISEVAYASGFSDPKYFTTCFRAEFGMTPRDYQKSLKA